MKMKKEKIILGILVLLLLVPVISATSLGMDMKESFSLGDEISFSYTITSETPKEIEYTIWVNCPNAPLPLLEIKTASLEGNVPLTEDYIYMSSVSEFIEPQTCTAIVGILNPEEISESKSFTILTNPIFGFDILTCKDTECEEQTKIFILNEDIYLDYTSEISNPLTTATLTYPDKTTQQLTIPTSIKAGKVGTYELEIIASKQGYKTITKKIQFGLIEEEANIPYTAIVQDAQKVKEKDNLSIYMLLVMICVILILILLVFIRFFRMIKKRSEAQGHAKLTIEKTLKKELKKKEKAIKKKERKLLRTLFHRKKKSPFGKKQKINNKIQQEKKVLTKERVGARKEISEKIKKEGKIAQKREEKEIGGKKLQEIRRLLSKGRRQLSMGNKFGAKNTYRKMRMLHASLKPGEKNRELYNQILVFHGKLTKKAE